MRPRARPSPPTTARGFSLVEMLVALAVFALAAMALLHLAGENTRAAFAAEERVLAGVVADNLAVDAMVEPAVPSASNAQGVAQSAGRDWHWTRRTQATAGEALVRIDVAVYAPPEWGDEAPRVAAERSVFRDAR
jgi:general secretion pathway protein I